MSNVTERSVRICILVPDLRLGGAQRVMLGLAREFAALGHGVEVVALLEDGPLRQLIPDGVSFTALVDRNASAARIAIAGIGALRRYLRSGKADCVLSTGRGTNLLAVLAGLGIQRPRLVLREAASFDEYTALPIRIAMRAFYRFADAWIGVSSGVATGLRRLGLPESAIDAIPNPVDFAHLRSLASTSAPATPKPYVITIGRLIPQKDHATLLRAFALATKSIDHDLAIVGNGELLESLKRLALRLGISQRVRFIGELANPYALLSGASLFVLSSSSEGNPNALLEALAMGVPVVSTDCRFGPSEILAGGRYGMLVPVRDARALAKAIVETLASPPKVLWPAETYAPRTVALHYLKVLTDSDGCHHTHDGQEGARQCR